MNAAIMMLVVFSSNSTGNIPPIGTFFRITNNGDSRITNDGDVRITN